MRGGRGQDYIERGGRGRRGGPPREHNTRDRPEMEPEHLESRPPLRGNRGGEYRGRGGRGRGGRGRGDFNGQPMGSRRDEENEQPREPMVRRRARGGTGPEDFAE